MLRITGANKILTDTEVLDGAIRALGDNYDPAEYEYAIPVIAAIAASILEEDKDFVIGYIKEKLRRV